MTKLGEGEGKAPPGTPKKSFTRSDTDTKCYIFEKQKGFKDIKYDVLTRHHPDHLDLTGPSDQI